MLCFNFQPIMSRLLITGSLAYDYILDYPGLLQDSLGQLHEGASKKFFFQSRQMKKHYGGCGGNVAYSLGLLGESPRLLSIAGSETGDYLEHLKAVGVDCGYVQTLKSGRTASCVILNDRAQNRIVSFHGGVVDRAATLDLKDAVDESVTGCILSIIHI